MTNQLQKIAVEAMTKAELCERLLLENLGWVQTAQLSDQQCGQLAYKLTQRMVIDMPTARALVDEVCNSESKQ